MSSSPPKKTPKRSVVRRLVRIFVRIIMSIVIILVIVIILIQTPYVQNIIRGKAEKYLSRKLNTRIAIGNLYIKFPESVVLKNVYVGDRQQDTLLSAGLIDVNIHMWGLLHNDLHIQDIKLQDITVKVKRQLPDTAFNFQFIVDAFAGTPEKKAPEKPSKPMTMYLGELLLDKIRLVYKDVVTGNDMAVWIEHSDTKLDKFDPATSQYSVTQFDLNGLRASIRQDHPLLVAGLNKPTDKQAEKTSEKPAADSVTAPLSLQLGKIHLTDDQLDYQSSVNAMNLNLAIGQLTSNIRTVDLDKNAYNLKDIQIENTAFRYDDNKAPRQKKGMDYSHLNIGALALEGRDIAYNNDSISGELTKGQFKEQSGFQLDELHTHFLYTDKKAALTGLLLRTPGTLLQKSVILHYRSMAAMIKDPVHTTVDLDMPGNRILVKDLLTFVPALANQPNLHPNDLVQVSTRITGNLDALKVQTLQLSGLQDLRLNLSGTIRHPMDTKRVSADLDVKEISGTRKGFEALLPKNTLPASIAIPARFTISGKMQGGMTAINTDLRLTTSSGGLALKGTMQQFRDQKNAVYDLSLSTKSLDLGYILKDSVQWGRVTASFTAKGKGFDPHTANAQLKGQLTSAMIRGYNYHNFQFDGAIADQKVTIHSAIRDNAVQFTITGAADLAGKYPALKLDLQLDTLDMHALHFVKDTLQFSGHMTADFPVTDPDSLIGQLKLSAIRLTQGVQQLHTDSILLVADRKDDLEDIQLHTEMADLDWKGRYKLTEVAKALQHTIDHYYRLNGYKDSAFTAQEWQMQLHARPSPLVLAMMPALKGTDTLSALISFNSDKNDLRLSVNDPLVKMGSQSFHHVAVNAATNNDKLDYSAQLSAMDGGSLVLHETSVYGYLADNKLFTSLLLKDVKNKTRYELSGELNKLEDGLKFMLNPDSLVLNYDKWLVSRDNFIQYDSAGIIVNDFTISNKDESLKINSTTQNASAPIDVSFTNFHLSTLSRFADQDSLLVDGTLNGKAEVKNALTTPVFTADLQIKGLNYKADTVGDIAIKVNNEQANAFAAEISLKGQGNDVEAKGEYYTGESRMNLKLDLRQLNLASIKRFAASQVQDMKGYLKGSLTLGGNLDKPSINGNLHFDSTLIVPVITGEPLRLSKDNIEFDADGFNFSEFALQDSAGNKATIDGNVYTKNYQDFSFDITVNAHNFRLVNAPEASSRMFYGTMNLDAAANLTGDMNAPKVDGSLRVNKKTNFVFVLPENNPEVVSREGVVRFVDPSHPTDTLVDKVAQLESTSRQAQIKGMELSMNIQTDSSAYFTMVIDERNGDALAIRGRSNLVFGMDRTGKMELTGSYEVESGTYNLSFNLLKRKFDIQRGSTITWTGSPTEATIDLTADYTANTPSLDLIENEVAGRTPDEITKFRQKLPFLVTLKMEGDLLKPKITFDISLPTDLLALWPDVDQRLQQIRTDQSELDKQVFALLLLNRFVGEDPLQSAAGGGTSVSSLAFQSASQILTNQLDQLAASLIKGVDIHFDLNNQQDFSTGTEQDYTELNVSVSKNLFNDRIQVSVGSDFDVQGTNNPGQNASNIAGDLAVNYKLTQDGRYALRAYRKNQYEAVIEGQVVETGVSFILTFDYNKLREIFKRAQDETLEERKTLKPTGGKKPNQ